MQENDKELVSIIIPCYNASLFIADAINSVLNQTYKFIEIIVINDGSKDNSEEVINSFGEKVIYKFQENQGVSAARNNGYKMSKGNYVCFLDADDWFYPNNIFDKIEYLKKNADVSLVHSKVDITDEKLNSTGKYLIGMEGENLTQALLNFKMPLPCPSNIMIKRCVLEKVGLFDTKLSTAADFDLWFRICQYFKVGKVDEVGIKYRQHGDNMFSNKGLYKHDMNYIYKKNFSVSFKWNFYLKKINFYLMLHSVKRRNIKDVFFYLYEYVYFITKEVYDK